MVIGFGLHNGGFFPDITAIATLATLAALLVRVTLAPGSFAGQSKVAAIALVALALLAASILISSVWSDAPSRAILEYGRMLLYAGLAALFVSVGRSEPRARLFVVAMALGCTVIGVVALGPWLMPTDFPVGDGFRRFRLNWPTSYWNATGLVAAFGVVLCVHLACSLRDHPVVRVLGAAAVPPLAATLVFSGSRGAVAAGVLGLAVYLVGRAVAGHAHRAARRRCRGCGRGARGRERLRSRRDAAERRRAGRGARGGGGARRRRGAHCRAACGARMGGRPSRAGDTAACATPDRLGGRVGRGRSCSPA